MSAFRVALLALLVASATVAALPTAALAGDAAQATGEVTTPGATFDAAAAQNGTANDSAANNSSFGADISSFMQSSAAEAGGAVETGMWTAAYNATENRTVRTRLVERRTGDLRTELADLRERKQDLVDEREAGNVSDAAYKARIGGIVGRINALESAIDATETRAIEVNANVDNVTRLRTDTEELTGPQIATVARSLSGVDASERGPSNGVGTGNGNDAGTGNGNDAGTGNGDGNGVGAQNENGNSDGNENGVGNGDGGDADGNGNDVGGNGNDVGGNDNDVEEAANGTTTAADGVESGLGGASSAGSQQGPPDQFGDAPTVGERPESGTATGGPVAPSEVPPAPATRTTTGGGPPGDVPAKLSTFVGVTGGLAGSVSDAFATNW